MAGLGARQFTLSQMGVSQWYSRCKLDGAADAPSILHPITDVAARFSDINEIDQRLGVDKTKAKTVVAEKLRPTVSALDLLHAATDANDLKVPDKKSNITEPQVDEPNEVMLEASEFLFPEAFSLKLYRTKQTIIISEAGSEAANQGTSLLLNNILKMTNVTTENADGCQYMGAFTWPVFKTIPSADEACSRLLSRWISSHVHSGDMAYFFFGGTQEAINLFCQNIVVSGADMPSGITVVSFPNALSELLALPSLKLKVWEKMIASDLLG